MYRSRTRPRRSSKSQSRAGEASFSKAWHFPLCLELPLRHSVSASRSSFGREFSPSGSLELLGRIVANRTFEALHQDRGWYADRGVDQSSEEQHLEIMKGLRADAVRTAQQLREGNREAERRGLEDLNRKAHQS